MTISLDHIGKRFNFEWIFRRVNYTFASGSQYAILGPNGSGKSTLLQIISGSLTHSEGTVSYSNGHGTISSDEIFASCSFSAPYLELIEEFTCKEFLHFHTRFKPFIHQYSIEQVLHEVQLDHASDKQIRYFSSGMKQRLKLAQAIFADSELVLLDEPCTNLDQQGVELYKKLILEYIGNRLLIVSSNDPNEYEMCAQRIHMADFKMNR